MNAVSYYQLPPWLRKCPKAWALLSWGPRWGQASAQCALLSAAGDRGPWSKRSESSENKFFLNLRFENHHPQCLLNLKFVSSILQEEKKKTHNNLSILSAFSSCHQPPSHLSTALPHLLETQTVNVVIFPSCSLSCFQNYIPPFFF